MFKARTHHNLSPAAYEATRGGHLKARRKGEVLEALRSRRDKVSTVAEIGSGGGGLAAELAAALPDLRFVGIDVDARMVSFARVEQQRPNLSFLQADITASELPLHFDFSYSVDVVHHVHEPLRCFEAVHRALPRGGEWLLIEPNVFHPYIFLSHERLRRAGFDEDHFRPWKLEPLMKAAGFAIASRRYAFLFPGWVKRVPGTLLRIERLLERFPFLGGSIIYLLEAR